MTLLSLSYSVKLVLNVNAAKKFLRPHSWLQTRWAWRHTSQQHQGPRSWDNVGIGIRVDVKAEPGLKSIQKYQTCFWNLNRWQRQSRRCNKRNIQKSWAYVTFFDVRISNPNALSNRILPLDTVYKRNEADKMKAYGDKMQVEKGSCILLLLNDAQPSRVARSIALSPSQSEEQSFDLSSDGLTSFINFCWCTFQVEE